MNNTITLKIQADKLIRMALEEDVSSEEDRKSVGRERVSYEV